MYVILFIIYDTHKLTPFPFYILKAVKAPGIVGAAGISPEGVLVETLLSTAQYNISSRPIFLNLGYRYWEYALAEAKVGICLKEVFPETLGIPREDIDIGVCPYLKFSLYPTGELAEITLGALTARPPGIIEANSTGVA